MQFTKSDVIRKVLNPQIKYPDNSWLRFKSFINVKKHCRYHTHKKKKMNAYFIDNIVILLSQFTSIEFNSIQS